MCSNFCQAMDDNYQGDLSDIIRASSACVIGGNGTATSTTSGGGGDGGFGSSTPITNNNNNINLSNNYSEYQNNNQLKGFYHPFAGDISTILGNHLDTDVIPTSTTLQGLSGSGGNVDVGRLTQVVGSPSIMTNNNICKTANNISSSNIVSSSMVLQDSNNKNNNNNNNSSIISYSNKRNMKLPLLGAAEASSKVVKSGFGFMSNNDMFNNNNQSIGNTKSGFVDGPTTGVQIPSPRNHQVGIKRRKIQAKKVVCIPAIAAANSRQTGEVVPSDLWAWRKYGQKPIKGSPYPRGYYRCSSSKGCSARKQVERSRTDPNMLVITYTSEHNHPWPTQRNALAGSTRSSSQPLKTSSKPCSSSPPNPLVKEDQSALTSTIKEEELRFNNDGDNKVQQGLLQSCENDVNNDELFNDSYRPLIVGEPNINGHKEVVDQDFFSDLVEFDSDDDLLKLFSAHQQGKELDDPFSGAFDWPTNNATTNEEDNNHIRSTTLSPTSKIS